MTTRTVLRGEHLQIVGYIEVNEKGAQVLLDAPIDRIRLREAGRTLRQSL